MQRIKEPPAALPLFWRAGRGNYRSGHGIACELLDSQIKGANAKPDWGWWGSIQSRSLKWHLSDPDKLEKYDEL